MKSLLVLHPALHMIAWDQEMMMIHETEATMDQLVSSLFL